MEIEHSNRLRTASFVILGLALGLIVAGCGLMLVLTWQVARNTDPLAGKETLRLLGRMAWLSASMLGLALLLLAWAVMRFLARRIGLNKPTRPTEYVDAWSVAGQRFQLPDDDADEPPAPDEGQSDRR